MRTAEEFKLTLYTYLYCYINCCPSSINNTIQKNVCTSANTSTTKFSKQKIVYIAPLNTLH